MPMGQSNEWEFLIPIPRYVQVCVKFTEANCDTL